jgi:hypothetical protein
VSKVLEVLIDMDSLLYAASSAAEWNEYAVKWPDGKLKTYRTRPEMMADIYGEPDVVIYERKQVGSFELAKDALHTSLAEILEQLKAYYGFHRQMNLRHYVGGTANFRQRIDSHVPYKHNRGNRATPAHLERLKEYCRKQLKAKRVDFWEADDEVAFTAERLARSGIEHVVVSPDKDLLQIPGKHLIPKHGFLDQTPLSAAIWLYTQGLSGDATDGVPGCPGIGAVKAEKLLLPLRSKYTEPTLEFHREAWGIVLDAYKKAATSKSKAPFPWAKPIDGALETMRLVYMLREEPVDKANPTLWEPL